MKRILIAFLAFTLIQTGVVYFLCGNNQKKIVYADAIRLFNSYKFKTDMEKLSQARLGQLKGELDSVSVIYKTNPGDAHAQELVAAKEQQLSQAYSLINKEINEKVWERLNPVINKFGKEQKLELLIGANGMGTVLYASDAKDVTAELIQYANAQYEKGN
jgi:outer membrane protein